MNLENMKRWAFQPDACRCCLATNGTLDLITAYTRDGGIKEVYSEMLQDCYGISVSCLMEWGCSRLVCKECVNQIRSAFLFRQQVLQSEELIMECYKRGNADMPVKTEILPLENDNDGLGCITPCFSPEDEDIDFKIQARGSTSQEKATVKLEKKLNKTHPRKRQKTLKTKRKRRKDVETSDSDIPIAELLKNTIIDDNMPKESKSKENIPTRLQNKEEKSCQINKSRMNVLSITSASCFADNKHLRANIALLLKNSTILPFKYRNHGIKYNCLYCDKSYLFFKELRGHVIDKHCDISDKDITVCLKTPKDLIKADLSDIRCKICDENFKTVEKIIEHLINTHNKQYFHNSGMKPSHGILGFDLSSETFKCHLCEEEFPFFKNLSMHMNKHSSNFMCHICGKSFVSDHRLHAHVVAHRKCKSRCKHCSKEFDSSAARNYHVRTVHHESYFKCPECSATFAQYSHRLKHLVEVHNFKKPEFKCDICSKEFASSGGLGAHVRYTHLKRNVFPCEVCGKNFAHKWIWQRHMVVHSGVKNYECKFCAKKFAKPYTLQVHLRLHLNDKRFSCNVCNASFIQKCSLKNHIKVNHPNAGLDLCKL